MAFTINPIDVEKLAAAREIDRPQIFEIVSMAWPSGAKHYGQMCLDELPECQALTLRPVEARFNEGVFQQLEHASDISDSNINLDFVDDDGVIADLCEQHGPGVPVTISYYFPDVDWLVERWWGHTGSPRDVGGPITSVPAAYGFRSASLSLPKRYHAACQFPYSLRFLIQDLIDESGCPLNIHIGGAIGVLVDGAPLPTCRRTDSAECARHLGTTQYWPGFDTVLEGHIVNETKGANLIATTKGNENNLKSTVGVVYGELTIANLNLLAYTVEPDTKHPDKGSALVLFEVREGKIKSLSQCRVNNGAVGIQHLQTRLGEIGQPRTGFSKNVNPYSGTALFYGVIQGDYRTATAGSFSATCHLEGIADLRVYTDPVTFTRTYSREPAWCILDMLSNKRRGDGRDISTFVIQDWLDVAAWHAQVISYKDPLGNIYTGTRATFNADLSERTAQQQIKDACMFAGLTPPFAFQGKTRILPLKQEDLTNVPVFTDDFELYANDRAIRLIKFDDQGSMLRVNKAKGDGELANHIELAFLDAAHDYGQRPLTFEDENAQFAEAIAAGDNGMRYIKREYSALGITDLGQAVRAGWRLLNEGEFGDGGLKNNCKVTFTASVLDTLDLHKYKVIKVVSSKLTRYGFQYFRIQQMGDEADLFLRIEAVAYSEAIYAELENEESPIDPVAGAGVGNPGGGPRATPCDLGFSALDHHLDRIDFTLEVC